MSLTDIVYEHVINWSLGSTQNLVNAYAVVIPGFLFSFPKGAWGTFTWLCNELILVLAGYTLRHAEFVPLEDSSRLVYEVSSKEG